MEVFEGTDVPVLVLTNQVDEIIFQQLGNYKNFTFVNIETSYDEIAKDLGSHAKKEQNPNIPSLPEEDVTSFSLWLKNELAGSVGKVTISKRLKGVPAVLFGQVSASMRLVMQMMDQTGQNAGDMNRNNTLEINPQHPIIVKLNALRKKDAKKAGAIAKSMMDNILIQSGIPYNLQESTKRNLDIMNDFLNKATSGGDTSRVLGDQSSSNTQ